MSVCDICKEDCVCTRAYTIGDRLRNIDKYGSKRSALWTVMGTNTLNGNLYLEDISNHRVATVTASTISQWERVRNDA